MSNLIHNLMIELNISEDQARKGAGAVLRLFEEQLGPSFTELSQEFPIVDQLLSSAPEPTEYSVNGDNFFDASMPAMGVDHSPSRQKLSKTFQHLQIDITKLGPFIDIVADYIEENLDSHDSEEVIHLF